MGEADFPPVSETHSEFTVGGWLVDPGQLTLSKDGEVRHLEPKAMDVLVYLVERVPDTVSNEEVQDKVWRGVVVGDNVVHRAIALLRKALDDDAREPTFILSVPRRGYRLIADVGLRVPEPQKNRFHKPILAALTILTAIGIWFATKQDTDQPVPAEPTKRVVFALRTEPGPIGEQLQHYIAQPLDRSPYKTDVISDVALEVSQDLRRLTELGVTHLLSIDQSIPQQFVVDIADLGSGREIWRSVYDSGQAIDLASLGARVAIRAHQVAWNLGIPNIELTDNLEAYDLYIQAIETWGQTVDRNSQWRRMVALLDTATNLDPDFASAYLIRASAIRNARVMASNQPQETLAKLKSLGEKYPRSARIWSETAHWVAHMQSHYYAHPYFEKSAQFSGDGWSTATYVFNLGYVGDFDRAIREARIGLERIPGNKELTLGLIRALRGTPKALEMAENFLRRFPKDRFGHGVIAAEFMAAGQPLRAVEILNSSLTFSYPMGFHPEPLMVLGAYDAAQAWLQTFAPTVDESEGGVYSTIAFLSDDPAEIAAAELWWQTYRPEDRGRLQLEAMKALWLSRQEEGGDRVTHLQRSFNTFAEYFDRINADEINVDIGTLEAATMFAYVAFMLGDVSASREVFERIRVYYALAQGEKIAFPLGLQYALEGDAERAIAVFEKIYETKLLSQAMLDIYAIEDDPLFQAVNEHPDFKGLMVRNRTRHRDWLTEIGERFPTMLAPAAIVEDVEW